MPYKIAFVIIFTMLISACDNDTTTQNSDIQTTKIQTNENYQEIQNPEAKPQQPIEIQEIKAQSQKPPSIDIEEIKVGETSSLDDIKNIYNFNGELKKLSAVGECGGFLAKEENEEENIYQYRNMEINIMNDQAVISKVIGFPDNFKFNYKGLVVGNNFTPKDLDYDKFEIFEEELASSQEILSIESTDIKTSYDSSYSLRENNSDDLFYLYFLNERAVALEIIVQC